MNDLVKFALEHGNIDKNALISIISKMDEERQVRFTKAALGIINPDTYIKDNNIPLTISHRCTANNLVMDDYNYFEDIVKYHCDRSSTRYFSSEKEKEEAVKYDYTWAGTNKKSDTNSIEHTFNFVSNETMNLNDWIQAAKDDSSKK